MTMRHPHQRGCVHGRAQRPCDRDTSQAVGADQCEHPYHIEGKLEHMQLRDQVGTSGALKGGKWWLCDAADEDPDGQQLEHSRAFFWQDRTYPEQQALA